MDIEFETIVLILTVLNLHHVLYQHQHSENYIDTA